MRMCGALRARDVTGSRGEAVGHVARVAIMEGFSGVGLATDLATEHGGTDANKGDAAGQLGRLNVADLEL